MLFNGITIPTHPGLRSRSEIPQSRRVAQTLHFLCADRMSGRSLVLSLVAAVLLTSPDVSAQRNEVQQPRPDEVPAAWGDLDTWSRYVPATDETEVGLGLKTAGAKTTMLIAFSARMKGQSPSQPPGEVLVHASAGVSGNARASRTKTLKFVLPHSGVVRTSSQGDTGSVIDLSSRLGADDLLPGAQVNLATARIAPAEFLRIARCGRPTATVLGVDVAFRPDQIDAIRAFARQILLKIPNPEPSRD